MGTHLFGSPCTCGIVRTFRRPCSHSAPPAVIRNPGKCAPLAPSCYAPATNVIEHEWNGATLLCDVSRDGTPRPVVPCVFHHIVFDNCHNLTHCGIRATTKFISETYTWPHLKEDCTVWVQSCVPCQQTKVRPYTNSAYQHTPS